MSNDYVEFLQDEETGKFYVPYATVYYKTKEEFEYMQEATEKQAAQKINKVLPVTSDESENECPECGNTLDLSMNEFNCEYCHWCGKKLDWSK